MTNRCTVSKLGFVASTLDKIQATVTTDNAKEIVIKLKIAASGELKSFNAEVREIPDKRWTRASVTREGQDCERIYGTENVVQQLPNQDGMAGSMVQILTQLLMQ